MPSAPQSSTRLATANAPSGMRTTGAAPPARMAAIPANVAGGVPQPMLLIDGDGGKPSRAMVSGNDRRGHRAHQPV